MASKLENKLNRMADPGYYVEYLVDEAGNIVSEGNCSVICISPEGTAKYVHWLHGESWITLLWSVAPTRKFMATKNNEPAAKAGTEVELIMKFLKWKTTVHEWQ